MIFASSDVAGLAHKNTSEPLDSCFPWEHNVVDMNARYHDDGGTFSRRKLVILLLGDSGFRQSRERHPFGDVCIMRIQGPRFTVGPVSR